MYGYNNVLVEMHQKMCVFIELKQRKNAGSA